MFKFLNELYEVAVTKVKDVFVAAYDWFDAASPVTKGLVLVGMAVAMLVIVSGCAKSDVIGKFADENGHVTLHSSECRSMAVMAKLPDEAKPMVKHGEMRPSAEGKKAGLKDMDFCYAAVDGLVLLVTEHGVMPIGPAEMFGIK